MTLAHLMPKLGTGLSSLCFITAVQAGTPLWRFTPNAHFPPVVAVNTAGTATVKYTVSNNTLRPRNLAIKAQPGISQAGPCFVGSKDSENSTCTLTLTITGSALPASGLSGGPMLCQANLDGTINPNQCYHPGQADSLAVTVSPHTVSPLTASVSDLLLSVRDLSLSAALTGTPRQITITNNGNISATGVSVNYPSWPTGTSATSTCGSTLDVGASCTITITPGATGTSGAGNVACTTGVAPTPQVISVSEYGSVMAQTNVVILGYGCIYQEGYIYAIDDTTPNTGSIGGTVTALTSQSSTGTIWSSDNMGAYDYGVSIWGIDEMSTTSSPSPNASSVEPATLVPGQANCNGGTDGACAMTNIIAYYSPPTTTPAINLAYYAAGVCGQYTIDSAGNSPCNSSTCYSNWYLPAIFELGCNGLSGMSCPSNQQNIYASLIANPATPNVAIALVAQGSCSGFPDGCYWSSTEPATWPSNGAWYYFFRFPTPTNSYADANLKGGALGVRCSRVLTL